MICGIDPGSTGAICILDDYEVIEIFDMPVMKKPFGKGNGKIVDSKHLLAIMNNYRVKHAHIEGVWQMPGQSAQSGFSFGMSFQAVISVMQILDIAIEFHVPRSWMGHYGIVSKKKPGLHAADVVRKSYPEADVYGPRGGLKDGRADALLIALYGRSRSCPKVREPALVQ